MDSPWDDTADDTAVQDVEWSRISNEFTNAGYREGITAGKEASSQEGFDAGYATVGVPLGRQLGLLRGVSSVLLSFLKDTSAPNPGGQTQNQNQALLTEAQSIASQLSRVRFSDIVPRDLEAEQHAREHLEEAEDRDDGLDENEDTTRRREMESIEDMLANLGAPANGTNGNGSKNARPTVDDVHWLRDRLAILTGQLGLNLGVDLKAIALPLG